MKTRIAFAVALAFAAGAAAAQSPSSSFPRGSSQQSWQNPGLAAVLEKCSKKPAPFRIGGGGGGAPAQTAAPPAPALPTPAAIPGVIAANQSWKVVWAWEGNNADGPIAGEDGKILFANQDASNVMELDPATGLAKVIHDNTNTGGALSRSKNGALFLAARGLGASIMQLEPQRKILANTVNGEPLDCAGGVANDLTADARGGVYLAVSGGGLFYSTPQGVMTRYSDITAVNGIVLSADERTLYVTNGPTVAAFDVQADGSLTNQREFAKLRSGGGGDGSAIDSEGRLYVATGGAADVFSPSGEFLGTIDGPDGMHGVAFGGRDKKTLYGIVFYGGWGTPSARNQVVGIPMLAQGYTGRAK